MPRAHRISFLKVLAAMAWADGVVEEDERNRIKILFNRFDLDPADRKEVDALLGQPVTFEQALEITKEFAGRLAPPGARKALIAELESMVGAEEHRAPEEAELLDHVKAILSSHTMVDGLVEKMRGLFSRTLLASRKKSDGGALTEYAKNSALQRLHALFSERGWTIDADLPDWNRVTLLGVLLAHVAHLGDGWHTAERLVVQKVLSEKLSMTEPQRQLLLQVMEEERERGTDLQRLCSEYCRISAMEERLGIVDALFVIASADGEITKDEVEQIRKIADFLWISNPEYLSVRDVYRDRIVA